MSKKIKKTKPALTNEQIKAIIRQKKATIAQTQIIEKNENT